MSAIILFRYHRAYDVCIQRLSLLRKLNPDVPIHGLYGGDNALQTIPPELTSLLVSNWKIPLDDPHYKWKNGDLCARWWFKEKRQEITFDHAYFLEWDQLFTKPLKDIYGDLKGDTNYATIFGDFERTKQINWAWLREERGYETNKLLKKLAEANKPVELEKLHFSIMGGAVFCHHFLERYIQDPVPSYSNDEVRFSVYSAAFNVPLENNFIMDKVKSGKNIYNANNKELSEQDLDHVIQNGGDVLHPLRIVIEHLEEKLGL